MELTPHQEFYLQRTKDCSAANRLDFLRMLFGNLTIGGIKDVQNIASRMKLRKKYNKSTTSEVMESNEEGWWEFEQSEAIMNWAGIATDYRLIEYLKAIFKNCREKELQMVKSTLTSQARRSILYPETAVSRPRPVPVLVGWWSAYDSSKIISMDCEMVSYIVGYKANGKPRCVQKAATVSVSSFEGIIIYKKVIYHEPEKVYITNAAKQKTGFKKQDFIHGTPLTEVQNDLANIFTGKLLIMIGCGSDFKALDMNRGDFDVFDFHDYFVKDTGAIGLRSLVLHYFNIDIQKGAHDADVDCIYIMKLFFEVYITEKLKTPAEINIRGTSQKFNFIKTVNK